MTDRFVCPKDHKHALNNTCWGNHRCRCDECREGQRVRMLKRRKDIAYGRHNPQRSNTAARRHIRVLRAGGWTVREIAAAAGVHISTINRARLENTIRIDGRSSDAILAVHPNRKPPRVSDRELVDATTTVRRLRALVYMGYTGPEIMAHLGAGRGYISHLMNGGPIFESTRRRVEQMYDDLWDKVPQPRDAQHAFQIKRARKRARDAGWVGPLGWLDIDDLAEVPDLGSVKVDTGPSVTREDEEAIAAAINGDKPILSPTERRRVVPVLNERRWSARQIASHIGCSEKTVDRIRRELGLPIYLANGTHYKDGTVAAA